MPGCGPATLVWQPDLCAYDFGPAHPMSPKRCDLTVRLADALGVLPPLSDAVAVDEAVLTSVHTSDFVAAVKLGEPNASYGLGTDDDPVFPAMHEVASRIVGASVEAARQVWSGEAIHAANIVGGLHHAMPRSASGFCIYNDVAVAIQALLDAGAERVAYVDVDVHHGDGVERIFWNDPRVLTISLHETGQFLFPGTGFATDTGGPDAVGSAVNVALPPGTGDAGWLRAFHAVVPPLLESFDPQILVTQHGCDSHSSDPLAHLELSLDGQRASYEALHRLAHEHCEGRWVALGGGGYSVVSVVPRAWTHLLGLVSGQPVPPETPVPEHWRAYALEACGHEAPETMTDGRPATYRDWNDGWDPDAWVDRQIRATIEAVFPLHGLLVD